jgi:hypothetical protein
MPRRGGLCPLSAWLERLRSVPSPRWVPWPAQELPKKLCAAPVASVGLGAYSPSSTTVAVSCVRCGRSVCRLRGGGRRFEACSAHPKPQVSPVSKAGGLTCLYKLANLLKGPG